LKTGPRYGRLESTPAISGTRPTIRTITSGINGALTKLKNFPSENARAARTESFSSRATWTAAMRAIAPPKMAQIVRNRIVKQRH
jgi:hypothetical protein